MDVLFGELVRTVPLWMLVSTRIGVAFAALPAPFGSAAPMQVRAALSLMLAALVTLPARHIELASIEPVWLALAGLSELAIGVLLGLVARLTLAVAEAAGDLAGQAMGLGFASTMDPTTSEQALVPGQLLSLVGTLTFFMLDGHHALIAALARSVEIAPPAPLAFTAFIESSMSLGSTLLPHALRVASPIVGTMFIVQLGVALLAKLAPRLQVFSLTFATAASVGVMTLGVALPSIMEAVGAEVRALPEALATVLGG